MEFQEYCAALSPWATINVNRKKHARALPVLDFMFLHRQRVGDPHLAPQQPADAGPQPIMRYALPGELPPSKYGAGRQPDVIARFDSYMQAVQKEKVIYGR